MLSRQNNPFGHEITRVSDVVYGPKYGMALTMDVWKPTRQNGVGVIFVISGAFKSGISMVDSGFFAAAMPVLLVRSRTLAHGKLT